MVGGAEELDWWEDITRKALYLNSNDFLPTRYKVSAKFKTMPSTPRSRAGPQPNDRSQPSPAKKRRTAVVEEVHILSDNNTDDEDYKVGEEEEHDKKGEHKDEDKEEDQEHKDDVPVEDLDPIENIATPLHKRSLNILESRASPETPPSSGTLGASSSIKRREKRKERDSMASILELFSAMLAKNQQKHDLQMAELSAQQERKRVQNLRLHKESWKIQMENSQIMMETQ